MRRAGIIVMAVVMNNNTMMTMIIMASITVKNMESINTGIMQRITR